MTVCAGGVWAGPNLWVAAASQENGNSLVDVFRALDGAIERLLKHANAETQLYVISDHGMGPHTGASYHLAQWLEGRGYMVRSGRSQARHSIISASRKAVRNLLPVSVRERVKAGIGEERVERMQAAEKDSFYSSIDWAHTKAYTEPGRHVININLQGRNVNGGVPASEYADVCSRIIDDLNQWTDDRGSNVVERVARRDEVYSGPFTERASDLYVYWNPGANLGEPPEEVRDRGFWWSGDHRPEGILICNGPGLRTTALAATPSVCDLVPTIMYGAGVPGPGRLEGRVIQEIFTDEFLAAHPAHVEPPSPSGARDRVGLSAEEEKMVEEKLRGLGYL